MADYSKMSDKDLDNQIMEKQKNLSPYHAMSDEDLENEIHARQGTAPKMSGLDAAIIKGGEGLTLGTRPLIAGAGQAVGQAISDANYPIEYARGSKPSGSPLSSILGAFSEGRHEASAEQKQAAQDHPAISAVSEGAGSLATAPFLPAMKGVQATMKLGAGLGAVHGLANADSVAEGIGDVGAGMTGAAIGHGIAKSVGAASSNVLKSFAENKAFKAAGAMLKDFRGAFNKDEGKINELGRTMLDNGLVQAGDSVHSIAQKSEALRRETGKQIGEVYDKVLGALTSPESGIPPEVVMQVQAAGFHPEMQAEEMKAAVALALKGKPGASSATGAANTIIDDLAMNGNNITPDHALELKGGVDHMINWSKKSQDLPLNQDALKVVRNYIQDRLNTQVASLDQVLGSSQSKELTRLNGLYGNVATIANVARDRVLRESANQSFGLGDKMGGGIGAILGMGAAMAGHGEGGLMPVAMGAAGVLGNKMARTYGNAAASSGAESLGNLVANPNNYAPALGGAMRMQALGGGAPAGGAPIPRMSRSIKARVPAGK